MTLRPTRSTLPDTRLPYTTRFRAASARHSARRLRGARAPTCIRGGKARPRRACAIAMIEHILAWLAGIIISVISATGYLGILILMAIESACIPLPSEVSMPFAGYLVSTGRFDLVLAATDRKGVV